MYHAGFASGNFGGRTLEATGFAAIGYSGGRSRALARTVRIG